MRLERAAALQAQPYQRTPERTGYANGYKPKTLATGLGQLSLQVPQVRGAVEFYPSALERGVRSERALKLAIAEMYVQGVSTRKVKAITEELCGHAFSASSLSAINKRLDDSLKAFAERPPRRALSLSHP